MLEELTDDPKLVFSKFKTLFDLGCFNNLSRFNTAGAHYHFFNLPALECANALEVRIKTTIGYIVSMADIVPTHGFLPTYFTHFGHDNS